MQIVYIYNIIITAYIAKIIHKKHKKVILYF
jgi:hypothetical protein